MTLPCSDVKVLLHGHLDGELDAANAFQVEDHLRACATCASEYQHLQELRAALREDRLRHRAPDALRARVLEALAPIPASPIAPTTARWWQHLWQKQRLGIPVAAFAAGLAVALIVPRPSPDLEQEIVSEHVRSLMVDHITDVTTSDRHTVKPWFDGRLDFAPPVVDLASEGFALTGGRLDYVAGRAVAALVYKRREHVINLFIWPVEKNRVGVEGAQPSVNNGYNTLRWSGSGMIFWAVSDLNAVELQEFMHRFQDQLARQ
ncbi:anti-sigma factor family protein [Microvirga lotononidis]|uniref:Putative transmembrane transcriptional regulator (Anti-sigma factor) n=1 Tax=Microvirga lotononidis TaxID=864069 RepID=I4YKK1_9HYPH|nr:anti-sigma factor [Microvirga lotononidis]EIM24493.1 putative transmembrane transcriptional regulator (anti-sigma factor) [Microvirga lotononidis]WQO26518.1 anti-sigma factor [Microvirga lotononidis]